MRPKVATLSLTLKVIQKSKNDELSLGAPCINSPEVTMKSRPKTKQESARYSLSKISRVTSAMLPTRSQEDVRIAQILKPRFGSLVGIVVVRFVARSVRDSTLLASSVFALKSCVYLGCTHVLVDLTCDAPKVNRIFEG